MVVDYREKIARTKKVGEPGLSFSVASGSAKHTAIQVVRGLTRPGYGWRNHPAVRMWRGYEEALGTYGQVCCEVLDLRGLRRHLRRDHPSRLAEAGVLQLRSQDELA